MGSMYVLFIVIITIKAQNKVCSMDKSSITVYYGYESHRTFSDFLKFSNLIIFSFKYHIMYYNYNIFIIVKYSTLRYVA